jgi:hypothetical protein
LGEDDFVKCFISIRNNSTHAETKTVKLSGRTISEIEQWEVISRAIQWVDEVFLWRLGYAGQYKQRDRETYYSVQSIQPRYNFSQRDPSW